MSDTLILSDVFTSLSKCTDNNIKQFPLLFNTGRIKVFFKDKTLKIAEINVEIAILIHLRLV